MSAPTAEQLRAGVAEAVDRLMKVATDLHSDCPEDHAAADCALAGQVMDVMAGLRALLPATDPGWSPRVGGPAVAR